MKIARTFSELSYLMKTGKLPEPIQGKHIGNWSLYYGLFLIEANKPYSLCMKIRGE